MIVRLFVAVGVVIAASGLGAVPVGPAPAAWSSPLVVDPAQGGDPDPGGDTGGDSSGDSSSGDAVASKPKGSESSDSGGDEAPKVEKAPDSAPDSTSDSGSSGEQADVAAPPPGPAAQDGTNSSGTDTPNATADPSALTEPDSGASGQKQNLSPVVDREPESDLRADNPNPVTQDLVDKYQTPPPADPNATAVPPAAPPGPNGEPPPVGVAPGPVRPGDPATTAADGTVVKPGTGLTKPPVDKAATWKCATMAISCDSAGVDFSIIPMQEAHEALDAAGWVPGANIPAGAINTTVYLGEGKIGEAIVAATTIVPGGKWVGKGVKWFKETGVYKKGEEVASGAWNRLTGRRATDEPTAGSTPPQAGANPTPPPQAGANPTPPPQAGANPTPPPQAGANPTPPPQAAGGPAPPGQAPSGPNSPLHALQVKRSDWSTKLSLKQGRHIKDHADYDKKGYFNSEADAKKVLDAFHDGSAQVLGKMSNGHIKVRYPGVTGYNNNPGAGYLNQPTDIFFIKGTKSVSVVPTSPK